MSRIDASHAAALLITLFIALPANASDFSSEQSESRAAWTGLYIGVQGGWAQADYDHTFNTNGFFNNNPGDTFDYDKHGGLLGGQIGYNWQRHALVIGLEASIAKSWLQSGGKISPFFQFDDTFRSEVAWIGSITPRVGLALGCSLVYAKGGWAFGGIEDSIKADSGQVALISETKNGWTAGGGLEVQLSSSLVLGAEYNYYDLGSHRYASSPAQTSDDHDFDVTVQSVTARLSYRFGERVAAPLK